jgi:molecular chaperone GrpE
VTEEKEQINENIKKDDGAVKEDGVCEDLVKKLGEEIALLKDALLRKAAEHENLRKRLEKEKEEAIKYSNAKFAKDLLPAIDNFERVAKNSVSISKKIESDAELKTFFEGILLCEKELVATLKKRGVSQIKAEEGDEFNHEYHQAISEQEKPNLRAGSIAEVFQTGYTYNDRLLRPTTVSVVKKA